jgi:hypothetical protein
VPLLKGATHDEMGRRVATAVTAPEMAAYRVLNSLNPKDALAEVTDVPTLLATLRDQAAAVNAGDLARCEAMLANQATALQSLFARLIERGMSYFRTPEHRARQSAAIRRWQPWEKSTGPKSAAGKARVARNAYKGGWRELLRELRQALREQDRSLNTRGG